MLIFLFQVLLSFSNIFASDVVTFSKILTVKDTVELSIAGEAPFENIYLISEDGTTTAKIFCSRMDLDLLVSNSEEKVFDLKTATQYSARMENSGACEAKLQEVLRISSENPFVFDKSKPVSIFGKPTSAYFK